MATRDTASPEGDAKEGEEGISADDLRVLRHLPSLLLREGYIDCHEALGDAWFEETAPGLAELPQSVRTLLALFALGQKVDGAALAQILLPDEIAALRRLGILLESEGGVHTAGLLLVPLGGSLLFIPHPGSSGFAYFGDDTVALASRLSPPPHSRCLDVFAGTGAIAVTLARRSGSVVAVESDPLAVACAELNLAMNDLDGVVELRRCALADALSPGEQFDFVSAVPPVFPFPPELAATEPLASTASGGDDGLRALRQLLQAVPRIVRPGGFVQLVASGPGNSDGPALCGELTRHAAENGLQIAMSVPSRVRMCPGDRLFELMAWRCAKLGGLTPEASRRRLMQHFATQNVDHLYRFFLSITVAGPRPGLTLAAQYRR